jgi:hypothetical protein
MRSVLWQDKLVEGSTRVSYSEAPTTDKTDLVQLVTEIDRIDVVALQIRIHDDLGQAKMER